MYDHLTWPLGHFHSQHRRYPIRLLRYWFGRSLIERQYHRLGRPLSILEVGIGYAELPKFVGTTPHIARWDGVDVKASDATRARYTDYIEVDVEKPFTLPRTYDAIILLHVLEHLWEPEVAMSHMLPLLNDGGLLLGGSPTMPSALAAFHEPWLRRKNRDIKVDDHRHLSVITPRRIRRFAHEHGLTADLVSGTFFLRSSGLFLEDYEWWARANLAWGATFPALGGELYFSLSK